MRLLIINQHSGNHGDEAAGKALLRALDEISNIQQIDILYKAADIPKNNELTATTKQNVRYCPIDNSLSFFDKVVIISSFLLPFFLVKTFLKLSPLKQQYKLMENADVIISAPSGVNIGPYKTWGYLWRLYVSLKLNKPLAIYSISFGPIPGNKLFKAVSLYILKKTGFLSLRDKKSQRYAMEHNINYIPSIDTAFLDDKFSKKLPIELDNLKQSKYVIVVPNALYLWHVCYMNINAESLDKIYIDIVELFIKKGFNVILLPQLFGSQNDSGYFAKLCQKLSNNQKVKLVSDKYNCDVQQNIINNAEFLVGARYHSIVFAIRGKVPFIALSYEHKMKYMLSALFLDKYAIGLEEGLSHASSSQIIQKIEESFANRETMRQELSFANKKSNEIARETFLSFKTFLEDVK